MGVDISVASVTLGPLSPISTPRASGDIPHHWAFRWTVIDWREYLSYCRSVRLLSSLRVFERPSETGWWTGYVSDRTSVVEPCPPGTSPGRIWPLYTSQRVPLSSITVDSQHSGKNSGNNCICIKDTLSKSNVPGPWTCLHYTAVTAAHSCFFSSVKAAIILINGWNCTKLATPFRLKHFFVWFNVKQFSWHVWGFFVFFKSFWESHISQRCGSWRGHSVQGQNKGEVSPAFVTSVRLPVGNWTLNLLVCMERIQGKRAPSVRSPFSRLFCLYLHPTKVSEVPAWKIKNASCLHLYEVPYENRPHPSARQVLSKMVLE